MLANISYITATKQTLVPKLSIILGYTAALMGIWTQVLMFIVSCSDPGVVSRKEDNGSSQGHMRTLSLNEEEFHAFLGSDQIYKRDNFY